MYFFVQLYLYHPTHPKRKKKVRRKEKQKTYCFISEQPSNIGTSQVSRNHSPVHSSCLQREYEHLLSSDYLLLLSPPHWYRYDHDLYHHNIRCASNFVESENHKSYSKEYYQEDQQHRYWVVLVVAVFLQPSFYSPNF